MPRTTTTRTPMVRFDKVSQDQWDRIFGKKEPDAFKKAVEAQKSEQRPEADNHSPAIHASDKLYRGFNWGLGKYIDSRTEWKREVKKQNVECLGSEPLPGM